MFVVKAPLQTALTGDHRVEAEISLADGHLGGLGRVIRQGQHVAAVAGQRQLQKAADKAGVGFDQREQTARGHVQPAEGATQQAYGFTHQPMVFVGQQRRVHRQHGRRLTFGLDQPQADVVFVGAHLKDGIFQLTRHCQRIPGRPLRLNACNVARLLAHRCFYGKRRGAFIAVNLNRDVGVAQRVGLQRAGHGWQHNAFTVRRAVTLGRQRQGTRLHFLRKLLWLGNVIHQSPLLGLLATHAFDAGTKQISQIMANVFFVGHPGQATRAGQHTQQRHFGQAHRARTIVHQNNLITRQCQLIAAARTSAIDGCQKLEATVGRRIFQAIARLIGELAKVHLPSVTGNTQHKDVGPGTKHFFFGAGDHHGAHFGVLKTDAVDGIVQLNIHPQVIAVELEFVAGAQTGVLVKVGAQRGDRTIETHLPVFVLAGVGLVIDASRGQTGGGVHEGSPRKMNNNALFYNLCIILHI